ncbi:hypothetical protein ACIRUY_01410 [Streptomyces erythrochromogenes]|uniref:hypothetical protein n=1 Tax=Streptomyces erythrochromogenes TaxID=285574 RepID=UPI00381A0D3E
MQLNVRPGAILTGAALYLGVQFWHTMKNRNTWPFCAYNMFNYTLPERWVQMRVVLYAQDGTAVGPTDPWCLLPVEFFRVVSLMDQVFFSGGDHELREEFCRKTLRRINNSPWEDFDEVRAAPKSPTGRPFVALEVYVVEVDRARCDVFDRASVHDPKLLHRHDPEGVTHGTGPVWNRPV